MRSLLFFALVCTCAPALATHVAHNEPLLTNTFIEGTHVEIRLANLEGVRTEAKIASLDNGDQHYRELVKNHNGYRVSFDVADLQPGRYIITITRGETVGSKSRPPAIPGEVTDVSNACDC